MYRTNEQKRQDYQREYAVAMKAIREAGFAEPIPLDVAVRYLPTLPEWR